MYDKTEHRVEEAKSPEKLWGSWYTRHRWGENFYVLMVNNLSVDKPKTWPPQVH